MPIARFTTHAMALLFLLPQLACLLGNGSMPAAVADSITLSGSTIPLRNVTIEGIQSGQVFYRDASGSRQRRALDDVTALGFDSLPQIDAGETAWRAGERDQAIAHLLEAFVQAERDLPQLWLHRRLAQMHDQRGEFLQSIGHAAGALGLDPSLYWRPMLEPMSQMEQQPQPTFAAAREAQDRLEHARNLTRDATLTGIIDQRLRQVRPLVQELARASDGNQRYVRGSTVSGILIDDIKQGRFPGLLDPIADTTIATDDPLDNDDDVSRADADADTVSGAVTDTDTDSDTGTDATDAASDAPTPAQTPVRPLATTEPAAPAITGPTAPDRIDALLADERYVDALELCRRVAAHPGERALDRFLIQYGRALLGVEDTRDASVMFTRCAVLFPDSPYSIDGLIETAQLYRHTFNRPATARRLLEMAEQRADALDQPERIIRVRSLMQQLPDNSS